jgi:hypothetical protein
MADLDAPPVLHRSPSPKTALAHLALASCGLGATVGLVAPGIERRVQHTRDLQRITDIERVRSALERYHALHGEYPPTNGEWSTSLDTAFLSELVSAQLLDAAPCDPRNEQRFHYRYARYPSGAYGCVGTGDFFVLAITSFEDPDFAQRNVGWFKCVGRSWNRDLAYVTGGGAALE